MLNVPVEAWDACLSDHPDRACCDYLLSGLREGFRTGYQHSTVKAYACGRWQYLNFCVTAGLPAVPAREDVLLSLLLLWLLRDYGIEPSCPIRLVFAISTLKEAWGTPSCSPYPVCTTCCGE